MRKLKTLGVYLLISLFLAVAPMTAFAAGKINLNTATVVELTQLKGIGEKTAQNILEYRSQHKFKSVDELTNVKGIGEKTLAKFIDQVTVDNKN